MLTYEEITKSEAIKTYIIRADESLGALGYTEHSFAHVMHVAQTAGYILQTMGYDERTVELAKIAGYLHDIGNLVNRKDHSQSGAVMAWSILTLSTRFFLYGFMRHRLPFKGFPVTSHNN